MQQRVTQAEVEQVEWVSDKGKFTMKPVPGTSNQIEADLILLAMGFVHPVQDGLLSELGLQLDTRKNLSVNNNMGTSMEKVFATGDAVNGATLVVTAIASGRKAAKKIDEHLAKGGV